MGMFKIYECRCSDDQHLLHQRMTLTLGTKEVQEQLAGYRDRCTALSTAFPELLVVDNCCTVREKYQETLNVPVGQDIYHIKMRHV